MEDWDQETLEKVVESKKTEYQQNKPTDIVCTQNKTFNISLHAMLISVFSSFGLVRIFVTHLVYYS